MMNWIQAADFVVAVCTDFDPDRGGWPVGALSESGRWVLEQIARSYCP